MPALNPRTNHRHMPKRLATRLFDPHRSELAMTTSSRDIDAVIGQESAGSAPAAAAALMLTSATLTFVVGVFALSANDFVVSEPGYRGRRCPVLERPRDTARGHRVSCLAIVVSFLWMPFYPTGSIVLIALDVVVIWGVATWHTLRVPA
jgi:hypothetical protein